MSMLQVLVVHSRRPPFTTHYRDITKSSRTINKSSIELRLDLWVNHYCSLLILGLADIVVG